jgi:hypothetical protein
VDFIVVGGVAIVLAGATYNTLDLDVVHSTDSENVKRLLAARKSWMRIIASSLTAACGPIARISRRPPIAFHEVWTS